MANDCTAHYNTAFSLQSALWRFLVILYLKLLLAAFFWGGTFVAGRIGAAHAGPFALAFLRFTLATAILVWHIRRREGALPRVSGSRNILFVLLLGATGIFAYNALFFTALQTIPAGRAAVVVANNPIVIALGAALFLGEPLTRRKCIGIAISVCGALVAVTRGDPVSFLQGGVSWGDVALVGCLASWAAYSLLGKKAMSSLSPLAAVTWSCASGACMLLPFALHEGMLDAITTYTPDVWASIFYLGMFGTALGFTWFYEGVDRIGAAKAGVFINFVPITAILSGWLFLGEPLSPSLILGAALVLTGVYTANR